MMTDGDDMIHKGKDMGAIPFLRTVALHVHVLAFICGSIVYVLTERQMDRNRPT